MRPAATGRPAVLGFFATQGAYPLVFVAPPGVVNGKVDLVGRGPDVLADREAVGGGVVAAGECHGGVSSKWCSGPVAAWSAAGRLIPSDGILDSGPVQRAAAEHWNPSWPAECQWHFAALRDLLADEEGRAEVPPGFTVHAMDIGK
ncbi:hypothetical protein ACFVRB_27660 [Streptomyces nojiriensis]|uniref:hypothetical protein n=1 Tax=Streptomyces nojiriensis TaxID=66374 RepID=UPI0036DC11EB